MTKEQFQDRLVNFAGVVQADRDVEVVGDDGKYVAKVVATTFEGLDEADRQEQIYDFLRQVFSDEDLQAVEYIITNAPSDSVL